MNYPCLIEEELEKSNPSRSSWKKRWVIATDTLVYYFEGKMKQKSKGSILFSRVMDIGPDPKQSKSRPHCFFIKVKDDDDKEETRYINCPSAQIKVKWMESIRTLSALHQKRDKWADHCGLSEDFRHMMMTNMKKALDHTCKLIGIAKALFGSRAKNKADEAVILKDNGNLGSTAIRTSSLLLKVFEDPFNLTLHGPMDIALKQLKTQADKIAAHCQQSSNKGAAEYGRKQINRLCDEILNAEKPTNVNELASVIESFFITCEQLLSANQDDLHKLSLRLKRVSQQFLRSARYVRATIKEESRQRLGLLCKEVEDRADDLIAAMKQSVTYSSADLEKAANVKYNESTDHIYALVEGLEAEWDHSIRRPTTVRLLGGSQATHREMELIESNFQSEYNTPGTAAQGAYEEEYAEEYEEEYGYAEGGYGEEYAEEYTEEYAEEYPEEYTEAAYAEEGYAEEGAYAEEAYAEEAYAEEGAYGEEAAYGEEGYGYAEEYTEEYAEEYPAGEYTEEYYEEY
eukprot:TRINITY_DN7242_c0_g1_i1.p2 TRINITY_DN7242_c0_g1~~TRINITY_DN7242_c0_g1_i1.p2  ORF type:complete len:515 (-),score=133.11 TRINITY_DN7242_c0_g1_i1:169-1713(-)